MTRDTRKQLKEIDGQLLRACLVVEGLIRQRAVRDAVGTQVFIEQFRHMLTEVAITARLEPGVQKKGGARSKPQE